MIEIYDEILKISKGKGSGVLVTVVQKKGSAPVVSGSKMLVYPDGKTIGTVGGGKLEQTALEKSLEIFKTKKNCLIDYLLTETGESESEDKLNMLCGGKATLFYEYLPSRNHIYIFGAGHIGKALVYHLRKLDYFITVIDDREEVLDTISGADEKISGDFNSVLADREVAENSYFIIATYKHKHDTLILKRIYKSGWNPKYIGVVASRRKCKIIMEELKSEVNDANLAICYIPVGLDIGGSSPDEIALSIIAEIQAVRYEKKPRHMRDEFNRD